MKKIICSLLVVLLLLTAFALSTGRIYNGLNKGIAWDRGGIEFVGTPGIFFCPANYDPITHTHTFYHIPAFLLPLVVDC